MHVITDIYPTGDIFSFFSEDIRKIAEMFLYKESYSQLLLSHKKMKKMNVVAFVMLISLLLLSQVLAEFSSSSNAETSSVSQTQTNDENQTAAFKRAYRRPRINCGYACARRCRETSRKKVCNRACGSCCAKCHCVPPGTSGNTAACPCYATLRTHGNKLKCP